MAKQLKMNLSTPSSSPEVCDILVNKIIDSYDRALTMVKPVDAMQGGYRDTINPPTDSTLVANRAPESPPSPIGSPRSQDSDMEFRDRDKKISDASKKRKAMPRWTKQVQVNPGSVSEGSLDDGHNWRKYGQKDILGAKYPRGYYRCTRRSSQGCLATKQVQRIGDNPTIFEITYRGRHTCTPRISSKSAPEKQKEPNITGKDHINNNLNILDVHHQNQQALLLVSNFQTGLRVETDDIDAKNLNFFDELSFSFPSSPNNIINVENYPFSANCLIDETLALNFPCTLTDYYTENFDVHISDQEILEKSSTAVSSANSINVALDYPLISIFAPDYHIW
ncbi:DNA-binding transcription factor [Lithospermum erythrorhizon]|uniref:DNA-binding transcription factor n=1 Tax=Lithospermum erythrorhizon TaxID=34254 RepID=A0AAV3RG26_LITER